MVARRHGLSESLLYNWRSVAKAAADRNGPEPIEFAPVGVIDRASEARPVLLTAPEHSSCANGNAPVGEIETQLPNGVRIRVNALMNEKALSRVFRALRGAV